MQIAQQQLKQIRERLDAPTLQETAWNEEMSQGEKQLILRAAGVGAQQAGKRWQQLSNIEHRLIGNAFRRLRAWTDKFAGVF